MLGNGRPAGIAAEDTRRTRRELGARLVVAADGRDSRVARWTRTPGRVRPHNRFFYWAYWRGVASEGERSRMWFMEPDCAYTFPNEDGLCVVLAGPHRDRLPEFRSDLEGAYLAYVAALPDAPDLRAATRESKLIMASSTSPTSAAPPPGPALGSSAMPRWRPIRFGPSAAAGRCRAPSGWSMRPPSR